VVLSDLLDPAEPKTGFFIYSGCILNSLTPHFRVLPGPPENPPLSHSGWVVVGPTPTPWLKRKPG